MRLAHNPLAQLNLRREFKKLLVIVLSVLLGAVFLWSEWQSPRVLDGLLTIRPPEEPESREWLQRYFQERKREGPQQHSLSNLNSLDGPLICPSQSQAAAPFQRTNLILASVGDGWEPRWLVQPLDANFDVAVVYYGSNASFECPPCSHVFHMRGPKWYLYHNLTESPAWGEVLGRGYQYIMLPDDDLHLGTCQLSRFFAALHEFGVLVAQPSVCRGEGSYTAWLDLYQRPELRLHFTNFVEIMAPAFRMDFFQAVVRHTLRGTYTGYGLDFVWPALLGWPRDRVAVVDEICMVHPPSPDGGKPGGLYHVTSKLTNGETRGREQKRNMRRYNYGRLVVWRNGMRWNQTVVYGGVPAAGAPMQEPQGSTAWEGARHASRSVPGSWPAGALFLAAAAAALTAYRYVWRPCAAARWVRWRGLGGARLPGLPCRAWLPGLGPRATAGSAVRLLELLPTQGTGR